MNKQTKQADYYMAGAFGLLLVSAGATLWLYARYQQAATAVEAALAKGVHMQNGKVVLPAVQEQAIADARLRTFLITGVLTVLCALGLVCIVLWHRKQRLRAAEPEREQNKPNEVAGV